MECLKGKDCKNFPGKCAECMSSADIYNHYPCFEAVPDNDSVRREVIRMIRERLGLKVGECFQFTNQKSNAIYIFTEDAVMKVWHGTVRKSRVSLNWLIDGGCEIKKLEEEDA